jgi:hypothetical protein
MQHIIGWFNRFGRPGGLMLDMPYDLSSPSDQCKSTVNGSHSPKIFRRFSIRRNVSKLFLSMRICSKKQQKRQPLRAAASRAMVFERQMHSFPSTSGQWSNVSLHSSQKYSKSGNLEACSEICCSICSWSTMSLSSARITWYGIGPIRLATKYSSYHCPSFAKSSCTAPVTSSPILV